MIDYSPHGFRSSFRSWRSDEGVDRELAEQALAHAVGSQVEQCPGARRRLGEPHNLSVPIPKILIGAFIRRWGALRPFRRRRSLTFRHSNRGSSPRPLHPGPRRPRTQSTRRQR